MYTYEERRARGLAAGSAREEVVTKSRRIRMRNRCSFRLYRSRGPYLPHLPPSVIDKVTIDVEERDRLRTYVPTLVRPNTRPTVGG